MENINTKTSQLQMRSIQGKRVAKETPRQKDRTKKKPY